MSASDSGPAVPHTVGVEVRGCRVELRVRHSRRARRIHLRVDPAEAGAELVLPRGVGLKDGLAFAQANGAWLMNRLEAIPQRTLFADGAAIPVLGVTLTIRHRPQTAGVVWREADVLNVAGRPEHVARRVRDWLRREALREFGERARALAARIDRGIGTVRLRDPRTRWGSCSARGGLAFSWRLILAPPEVVDYVVAHEVAHLVEFHHGPRFWRLVESLAGDTRAPRRWLAANGPRLLRYG